MRLQRHIDYWLHLRQLQLQRVANFDGAQLIGTSTFAQCQWDDISFAGGRWNDVGVLNCGGTVVHAQGLQGRSVDFTGSTFEQLEFQGANIN